MAGAKIGEIGGCDSCFFPPIENDVLYVSRINHESHFACQAQYLTNLEAMILVSPPIENDTLYVTQINHKILLDN